MIGSNQERMFSHAMYALRKIANRVQTERHTNDPHNTCGCSKCVAKDALEQIAEIEKESFVKATGEATDGRG